MVGKDEKLDEGSQKIEGQYYSAVTILFADFVGFTKMVENTEPGDLLETLNTFFSGFEKITKKNNVLKVKTIGDCFMCWEAFRDSIKATLTMFVPRQIICFSSSTAPTFSKKSWVGHDGNCALESILDL